MNFAHCLQAINLERFEFHYIIFVLKDWQLFLTINVYNLLIAGSDDLCLTDILDELNS